MAIHTGVNNLRQFAPVATGGRTDACAIIGDLLSGSPLIKRAVTTIGHRFGAEQRLAASNTGSPPSTIQHGGSTSGRRRSERRHWRACCAAQGGKAVIMSISGYDTAGVYWEGVVDLDVDDDGNVTGTIQWTSSRGADGTETLEGVLDSDGNLSLDGTGVGGSGIVVCQYEGSWSCGAASESRGGAKRCRDRAGAVGVARSRRGVVYCYIRRVRSNL